MKDAEELVEEIIDRFLAVDLVAFKAQTHASLTGTRALIRWYEHTGKKPLLLAAEKRYQLYRSFGMTETFANYNWFGRPEWTEPCAIIDSFLLAVQLWRHTQKTAYLEDAHHIWFNALGRAQRSNGGYGTESCTRIADPTVRVSSYEAFWCCTMRGGEGHARSIQYLYFTTPNEIFIPFFNDSIAELDVGGGTVKLRQSTDYAYAGRVNLDVVQSSGSEPVKLRILAPAWTANHQLSRNGKATPTVRRSGWIESTLPLRAGDSLRCNFDLRVALRPPLASDSRGYGLIEAGPLLMGAQSPEPATISKAHRIRSVGPGIVQCDHPLRTASRLNNVNELQLGPKDPCTRQVLYRIV